jgi:SAM-dependent methyltransferase
MSVLREIRSRLGLPHRFSRQDFEKRDVFAADYQLVARALTEQIDFATVLDLGCANGFLMGELHRFGKIVRGLELSPAILDVLPPELAERVDIGDFTLATGTWDLVACVEVAEHISPERSLDLVTTLAARARRWIYFTAAPPGQKGKGHINCRLHEEWVAWFRGLGWRVDEARTTGLRGDLDRLERATWLRGNSLILRPLEAANAGPAP